MAKDIVGTFAYDNLIGGPADENDLNGIEVVLKSGETVVRGALIVALAADAGVYTLVNSTSVPTSAEQKTFRVLAGTPEEATLSVDTVAIGYSTGKFVGDFMQFGGAVTKDTYKDALRDIGIIVTDKAVNAGV